MKHNTLLILVAAFLMVLMGCNSSGDDQYVCFDDPSDPICVENSYPTCNNGFDDDSDGGYDCRIVEEYEAQPDQNFFAHEADPNCCPMAGFAGANCNMDLDNNDEADFMRSCCTDEARRSGNCFDYSYPDACRAHADLLGCDLPMR